MPTLELVIFVGLQAAGKSSFYRAYFEGSHVLVSKDLWPNARNREQRQRRLVGEALAAGSSVVVDNTNPTPESRAPLVAIGRAHDARVLAYGFESDLRACLERNARREGRGRVPDVALHATSRVLRFPAPGEGFDAVYAVRIAPGGGFEVGPAGT